MVSEKTIEKMIEGEEAEEWFKERIEKSDAILAFLHNQEMDNRYSSALKGHSLKNSVTEFLGGRSSNVGGVLRLWEHEPHLLFHFSAVVDQPIPIEMFLNISFPLPVSELTKDDKYGWMVKKSAPNWLKILLQQFYNRKKDAERLYTEYIKARDIEYARIVENGEIEREYRNFYNDLLQHLQILEQKIQNMVPDSGFTLHLKKIEENPKSIELSHLMIQNAIYIRNQLDKEEKKSFDHYQSFYKKIQAIPREVGRDGNLFTLPKEIAFLGAERARVLGFMSDKVSHLSKDIEWSCLSNQPFFWFSSDESPLHDIKTYDWTSILSHNHFSANISINDICFYNDIPDSTFGNIHYISLGSSIYEEEEPNCDYDDVINNLKESEGLFLDSENQFVIHLNVSSSLSFREWLTELVTVGQLGLSSNLMLLDSSDFLHIDGFPSEAIIFKKEIGQKFLGVCWEFLQEKFKDEAMEVLRKKHALLLEKPLNYLFESAGNDLSRIKQQVELLVNELVRISENIENAQEIIINLAGGWTPTWVEKEIFILKKVLAEAEYQELPREKLLSNWAAWLKAHGSKRSERELMYNLRGLERAKVLQNHGIFQKTESREGAGAKSTIFYLQKGGID